MRWLQTSCPMGNSLNEIETDDLLADSLGSLPSARLGRPGWSEEAYRVVSLVLPVQTGAGAVQCPIPSCGIGPHGLQTRAWAWLAAETDDLAEQKRCLEAIVSLDPTLDWAQAVLTRVWYRWRREN